VDVNGPNLVAPEEGDAGDAVELDCVEALPEGQAIGINTAVVLFGGCRGVPDPEGVLECWGNSETEETVLRCVRLMSWF